MSPRTAVPGTPESGSILHIGLFFDGTRNNINNLPAAAQGAGVAAPPLPLPVAEGPGTGEATRFQSPITSSRDNAPTHIARLHGCYPDGRRPQTATPAVAIYTEGTGTLDGRPDDLIGLAFGTGPTGVRAKTNRALQVQLPAALASLAAHWRGRLQAVEVDLFGYSRGAASAREAANRLSAWSSVHWQGLLREAGLALSPDFALAVPVIRFIGLFDTVLAVRGRAGDRPPRMRLAPGVARKVLHLVARDEHRLHFPLTTVAPEHEERALPGSHADIGGGQDAPQEGPKLLTRPRSERILRHGLAEFATPPLALLQATPAYRQALQEAGAWRQRLGLDATQISVAVWHQWVRLRHAGSTSVLPAPTLHVYAGVVLDRPIDRHYPLIPLRLMHAAAARAGVSWSGTADAVADGALPPGLQSIAATLMEGRPLDAAAERQLRQHHLLQSAHWNFDVLGDTALTYASGSGIRDLPYRPGPGLFYINQPTHDGQRKVLPNV